MTSQDGESAPQPRPLIGISCHVEQARWGDWDLPAVLVPAAYVDLVAKAGGRPLVVPPMAAAAAETVAVLDGLVLAGGADIGPEVYGQPADPRTTQTRPDRDGGELAMLTEAQDRDLPILGICRGAQLLTVARGAALDQHLQDGGPAATATRHRGGPGRFTRHDVAVVRGSLLSSIVGTELTVSSNHHQAPLEPGHGLAAVAHAPDGVLEGVEDPERAFCLGVLWHPEADGDVALFSALVGAARTARTARA
ncbi:MAG: gamma-glutamyl-gamma-aminobutyrate hydrolase family protein [Jiangellaceae bacterium]